MSERAPGVRDGENEEVMKLCPLLPLTLALRPSPSAAGCEPWWQLLSTRSQLVPCPMSGTQPLPNVVPQ